MILFTKEIAFAFSLTLLLAIYGWSCKTPVPSPATTSFRQDSLQVEKLLKRGDSLYARRSGTSSIAESLIYFDSANRVAQRLGDTLLLANTLFFIGNVYNAWNREPSSTVKYYRQSSELYNRLPQKVVKAFYVRYILAHAFDKEKAADSLQCIQTLSAALHDLQALPDSLRQKMAFVSDFAWVASNDHSYTLAETFLATVAPRHRIFNDPKSNNYLDHYYLTRARIDVWGKGLKQTAYLDSLRMALAYCGNRYDSVYYSRNLSLLYESTGDENAALRFSRLAENLNNQMGEDEVLNILQQELLRRTLQSERYKQQRIAAQLKSRNILIIGSLILLVLLVLLYAISRKRQGEKARSIQQETFTGLLLQKEEEERRRLATDLHDGVNHELLALKNNLLLQKPVSAADVESVITSVREVSRNLYPAMFESVGLSASVDALCERFTAAGFFTSSDIQYDAALTKDEELQVYRIIQECLNNVAKHAHADAAKITIRSDGVFRLEIKDNGRGFDVEKATTTGNSFGLQSIRQRVNFIDAQFSISSSSKGTIIYITKGGKA